MSLHNTVYIIFVHLHNISMAKVCYNNQTLIFARKTIDNWAKMYYSYIRIYNKIAVIMLVVM